MTCYLQPLPPKEFATLTILNMGECDFDRRSLRNLLKFLKNLESFSVILSNHSESTPDTQTVQDLLVENQKQTLKKLEIWSSKVLPPLDSISHLRGLTSLKEAILSGHLVDRYIDQREYSDGFFPNSIEYACLIDGLAPLHLRKGYDYCIGHDMVSLLKRVDKSGGSRSGEYFIRSGGYRRGEYFTKTSRTFWHWKRENE